MFTNSFLASSFLLATVSASPLLQEGIPVQFLIPRDPGDPVQPTATGAAANTATASSGGGDTQSVNVKGSISGPLAVTKINDNDGIGSGSDTYKMYKGDGSSGAGWPKLSDWVSFGDMFTANKEIMKTSCSHFGVPDNTDEEISDIHSAIQSVALATEVDHRFILAIMMEESKGCVRVHTTDNGVRNPGLMQDHDGRATCNDNNNIQTPCPKGEIIAMIAEGTGGTTAGDGLVQLIIKAGGSDAQTFYKAARMYNSNELDPSGDLEKGNSRHCYASNVANRLTGWTKAPLGCDLDGQGGAAQ